MSVLRSLEEKIAGLVEGTFSRAFRSEVRPVEIAAQAGARNGGAQVAPRHATYVPERVPGLPFARATGSGSRATRRAVRRARRLPARAGPPRAADAAVTTGDRVRDRRPPGLGEFGIQARGRAPPGGSRRELPAEETVGQDDDLQHGGPRSPSRSRSGPGPAPRARCCCSTASAWWSVRRASRSAAAGSPTSSSRTRTSRASTRIRPRGGSWVLTDLGSTNGSRINGRSVEGSEVLRPGDEIELGSTTLRFELE